MASGGAVSLTPVDYDPWEAPEYSPVEGNPFEGGQDRSFLLIRHGATALNDSNNSVDRIRGWKDIPLSDEGKKEAERLGQELRGTPLDVIYASDLKRARDTAMIIADAVGVETVIVTRSLRPWNVGELSGVKTSEALPVMARYIRSPDETIPGGEPFNSFRKRAFEGLKKILLDLNGRRVAVVTHHRVERLVKGWQAAGFPPSGDVDIPTFEQKGESTGHAEMMDIPASALADAP